MSSTRSESPESKGWRSPWPVRVTAVVIGLGLFVAGGVSWELETIYGGDPDRQEYVIGWDDELGGAVVLGEDFGIVYEANDISDAEAWVESQRGGRNYTLPILLFVGSAVFVLIGVAPPPSKEGNRSEMTRINASA